MTENAKKLRQTAKLDNWAVAYSPLSPYSAPEQYTTRLCGKLSNHPRLVDGTNASTSLLVELNVAERRAKTMYTDYELGEPCSDFLAWLEEKNLKLEDYDRVAPAEKE